MKEEDVAHKIGKVLKRYDVGGNGVLNYDDFLLLFSTDLFTHDSLKIAFNAFDDDSVELLSVEDVVRMGGHPEEKEFWESLLNDIDPTGKGGLGFEEFCELILKYAD